MKIYNKRKKRGSMIQLLIFIIIFAGMLSVAVVAVEYVQNQYRMYVLTREVSAIREESRKFETMYGVPPYLVNSGWSYLSMFQKNNPNVLKLISMSGLEAFRLMKQVGMLSLFDTNPSFAYGITAVTNTQSITSSSGTPSIKNDCATGSNKCDLDFIRRILVGNLLPYSKYNINAVWVPGVSANYFAGTSVANTGISLAKQYGLILNLPLFALVGKNGLNPNMTLANPSTSIDTNPVLVADVSFMARLYSNAASTTVVDAKMTPQSPVMSASEAKNLDLKIDDGKPLTGFILADNPYPFYGIDRSSKGGSCIDAPLTNSPISTNAWSAIDVSASKMSTAGYIKTVSYNPDSISKNNYGCILFVYPDNG
ncbi:hypothetical protein [Candidatus Deianiraea vastatrix]|uniref:Uncharacterized protein n=1 Tax=Candidatus Deianiraea vastatrix TaxID=2163644 RepID=A0A5B8XIP7_9RICK|nr:hypothetical protein [Candidatus Deianiraea vastatrix]QED23824.1 hypothetical protein Deia_01042 [Candidatus Deianiraea vastatrix]